MGTRYKLTFLSQLLTEEFRKQDLNKETPRTSFGSTECVDCYRSDQTYIHPTTRPARLATLLSAKVQVDPTTSCSPASPASTSKMSLVFSLLMGTVVASAVVVLAIIFMANRKEIKFEKRKTSHVTEVLQVDMIDRRLRSTSLDHSLDMDLVIPSNIRPDDVIQPVSMAGQCVTKIE